MRSPRATGVARACAAAALAACYAPAPPPGVPCTDNRDCPAGQACDPRAATCGPPDAARAWRDDTAADFAAEGAVLDGAEIEPGGFVGPTAYLVGGARLTGIGSAAIGAGGAAWDALAALPVAGRSLTRGLAHDFNTAPPPGVGLGGDDDITVLLEAEVLLDAPGAWDFQLFADDRGFLEIARPGSRDFVRVTDAAGTGGTTGEYQVTAPGWHRVRAACSDLADDMNLEIRYDPPNASGGMRRIPGDRVRAPVGDLTGLLVDGFEDAYLIQPRTSVLAPALASQELGANPFGLPVGSGSFALRWSGQVRIDTGGSYALRLVSAHGHRAWLGGALVADTLGSSSQDTTTEPVPLEPGWHDLVIDTHRNGTAAARVAVTVAEGPVWVGQQLPAEHLRPVVGRRARWAAGTTSARLAVADAGAGTRALSIEVPAGFAASRIDAAVTVDHPVLASLAVVLDPPAGANVSLAAAGDLTGSGQKARRVMVPAESGGGAWSFTVTDTAADAMSGALLKASVTMIGAGGPAPFAERYRYESPVRDLGDAVIGPVRWGLRQAGAAGGAAVYLRTCDEAAACAAEPWTQVTAGAPHAVPPRRFAQYAVALTSDGDTPVALDWIELEYATR